MRIELRESCNDSGISHGGHVDGVHIVLLDLLKNQVKLSPSVIVTVKLPSLEDLARKQSNKNSQDYAQECYKDSICILLHLILLPAPLLCRLF